MNYTDNGILLDYDLLKSCFPLHPTYEETIDISPLKTEKINVINDESEKGNKKQSKPSNMKGVSTIMKKTSALHFIDLETQKFPLEVSTENRKGEEKKSVTRSGSKKQAKELDSARLVRKKVKVDITGNESKIEIDETEFDSIKETTQSVISDTKEQYINPVNIQAMSKQLERRVAKKGKKNKGEKNIVFKESVIGLIDDEKKANYLINPIPNFFEKFKTDNMYIINRSFYFDPINLSLSS